MTGAVARAQTLGGPALFVLLWSTGFVGAKYGLPYAEPFTFLGVRLVVAAALLALLALALGSIGMPARPQYGRAAVVGLLLHAGYLGGVFYAISLGIPAGVSAVVLNVTVTQPSTTSFLTAFPTGESRPGASNLNFTANQTVPNLVVAKVGAGGKVSLYNALGTVHVIADVAGWYDTGAATSGARYTPLTSSRILDTRSGNGAPAAPLGPGASVDLQVTGRGGVPASGVSAVVLNVSVTQPSTTSFLTAFPTGQARPGSSNLNFTANQSATNVVVAKVGAEGKVTLYNALGTVHVLTEVAGWYDAG